MLVKAKVTDVALMPLKITATARINKKLEVTLSIDQTTPGLRNAWNNHRNHLIAPGDTLHICLKYYPKRRNGEEIEIISITKLISKNQAILRP